MSKGYVEGSSKLAINEKFRPHLELLLSSQNEQGHKFQVQTLPLFVSYFGLNNVNIMLDDNCEVSGLIDWELSTPLPFGVGFSRIHTLAGEYSDRKFHMPPEFKDAEK